MPHTNIWLVISVESYKFIYVACINDIGSGLNTKSDSNYSASSILSFPYNNGSSYFSSSSSGSNFSLYFDF